MSSAFLKKRWLSNTRHLGLLSTVSLQDFAKVFAKAFDVAITKEGSASEMVAENLTQQFELSV